MYPLAFETVGGPGPTARTSLATARKLIEEATGNPRASEYLLQNLALDVQRGYASDVMGTMLAYQGPGLQLW